MMTSADSVEPQAQSVQETHPVDSLKAKIVVPDQVESTQDTSAPVEYGLEHVPELIEAGTRALALGEFDVATDKLALAVELQAKTYGQTARECADTLFLYGKALLVSGVAKSSLLNEKPEETVQTAEDAVEAAGKSGSRFVFNGDAEGDASEEAVEPSTETTAIEAEDEEPACALEDIDTEEVDDIELAWETLDLARLIYSKSETQEDQLKLGDVHLALGDVSLESENFEQAVEDFRAALEIKSKFLEENHRELAEAHYKLALALEYSELTEDAVEQVRQTMDVMNKRLEFLRGDAAPAEDVKGKGKAVLTEEAQKEIEDIEALFPEMQAKLDELLLTLEKEAEGEPIGAEGADASSADKPQEVKDVSSLVKKRKVEEVAPVASEAAPEDKKVKTDDDKAQVKDA